MVLSSTITELSDVEAHGGIWKKRNRHDSKTIPEWMKLHF